MRRQFEMVKPCQPEPSLAEFTLSLSKGSG
jgi:hypothetical protein